MVRVGINGFGRIGRLVFKALLDSPVAGQCEFFVNEIKGGTDAATLLLNFGTQIRSTGAFF